MAEKLDKLEKEKEREKEERKRETPCSYALRTRFDSFSIPPDTPQMPTRPAYRG